MTDLVELLERASEPTTLRDTPIASDIARGRAALRRRRAGMAGGVLAAAVLVGGAGGLAITRGTAHDVTPAASGTSSAAHHPAAAPSPKVSPFTGSIGAKPFTLRHVPSGWKVQGWSPSAVVLVHANGSPHTTVQDFEGKIAVISATQPPKGGSVHTVDGKRFRVTTLSGGGVAVPVVVSVAASYDHAYLLVQGPAGTDPAQLLQVAGGVTATGDGSAAIG